MNTLEILAIPRKRENPRLSCRTRKTKNKWQIPGTGVKVHISHCDNCESVLWLVLFESSVEHAGVSLQTRVSLLSFDFIVFEKSGLSFKQFHLSTHEKRLDIL